jgi:hypothetical protein
MMEHAMALPLAAMMEHAARQDLVLSRRLDGGRELLVYPLPAGSLLGVGVLPEQAHHVDPAAVLHRRGCDMDRYGAWLPALFDDGSLYVLYRCAEAEAVPAGTLLAGQELLDA